MKRVSSFILTAIFLFIFLFSPVTASSETLDLDDLGLQVTIPSGYSVITRQTPASDPVFRELGTSKSELISHFQSSNIYLNAISDTYNEEIVVTMSEIALSDFNLLSDVVLETLASSLADQYADFGIHVSKYDIYHHSQATFIRLYFTDTGKTVHGLQYYTAYDGKAMNFTMRSYEGSISARQEQTIKTVIDSIRYDKEPSSAASSENTEAFVYTDQERALTFTVPANWKQEALSKDREYIDAKFLSTKEAGQMITYGSTDLWSQIPAYDKIGRTRSDLNNSAFTLTDIAETFGATANNISMVTYNNVQYFKIEAQQGTEAYGFNFTFTLTQLVYIDNGWAYTFQFNGNSTHKLYSDFEMLMETVQYPSAHNNTDHGSTDIFPSEHSNTQTPNSDNYSSESTNAPIIIVAILLIIIGAIGIITVLKRRKSALEPYNIPETPQQEAQKPINICRNCGWALPLDSIFCHNCGCKIEKENR